MTAPSPLRDSVSRASAPASRFPRWVPGVVAAILLIAAAVVGGTSGWILLAAATVVLGWLVFLLWPHLALPGRLMQAAIIVAVYAAVAVAIVERG